MYLPVVWLILCLLLIVLATLYGTEVIIALCLSASEHSHGQDFDIHNLLPELPADSGVEVIGPIVGVQIPGGIDAVSILLMWFLTLHNRMIKTKLREIRCNIKLVREQISDSILKN